MSTTSEPVLSAVESRTQLDANKLVQTFELELCEIVRKKPIGITSPAEAADHLKTLLSRLGAVITIPAVPPSSDGPGVLQPDCAAKPYRVHSRDDLEYSICRCIPFVIATNGVINLDLNNRQNSHRAILHLLKGLLEHDNHTRVGTLDLTCNADFDGELMEALCKVLTTPGCRIRSIQLCHCEITDKLCEPLLDATSQMKGLETLIICYNRLTNDIGPKLIKFAKESTVRTLDVHRTEWGCSDSNSIKCDTERQIRSAIHQRLAPVQE